MKATGAGRRLGLLASLYLAQGLPFGFFVQALPVMLRKEGRSLGEIGLSSLLAVPWALKFLWAPAVDRFGSRAYGRRRSWIVPVQMLSVATVLVLAATRNAGGVLLPAVLLLNLLAATQDIATDGLAVDTLRPAERGIGNGVQVAGYRVGMIIGGGILLVVFERLGWCATFIFMAALLLLASAPVLASKEDATVAGTGERSGLVSWLRVPGAGRALAVLLTYKFGDSFASAMLRPFLADAGLGMADIGVLLGTVGFLAGLIGALVGGALVNVLGTRGALASFGVLQALSIAGYAVLASGGMDARAVWAACAAEHLAGGMATAALFTSMMDLCRPGHSASDYTVQACAVVVGSGLAGSLSGVSAQSLGYAGHFATATILAATAPVLVLLLMPAHSRETLPRERVVRGCA
jgi:RhtX/FptX family siderophore transporter